jgi:predicted Fe-S protein YdhL (DUF1289 family)
MKIDIRHAQPTQPGVKAFLAGGAKSLLIGPDWKAAGGGTLPTRDPATGAILAEIGRANAADVDLAVAAARTALETGPWAGMTPMERARILSKPIAMSCRSWRPWIRASPCSSAAGRRFPGPSTSSAISQVRP